jgi:hypothetical protein
MAGKSKHCVHTQQLEEQGELKLEVAGALGLNSENHSVKMGSGCGSREQALDAYPAAAAA